MTEIDYDNCTIQELEDVLQHIDREKYPRRYEQAEVALAVKLEAEKNSVSKKEMTSDSASKPGYKPTKVQLCMATVIAVGVIIYSLYFGSLPLFKSVNVSVESDPIFYWGFIAAMMFVCFYNLYRVINFGEKNA